MSNELPTHSQSSQPNQHVVYASKLYTTQQQDRCQSNSSQGYAFSRGLCPRSLYSAKTTSQNKTQGLVSMLLLCTVSSFYRHCVTCKVHVRAVCLCRALVSASSVFPAGLMTRWVSDCVFGAWRAPSVLREGPLMGSKLQRQELQKLDNKVHGLQAELRHSHAQPVRTQTPHLCHAWQRMYCTCVCCVLHSPVRHRSIGMIV